MLQVSRPKTSYYKARIRREEFALIAELVEELVSERAPGNTRILEFGCGSGLGSAILTRFGSLTMSDIYLDARLTIPQGACFVLADIKDTPFDAGSFDMILSSQVLEHIDGLERAFEEMRRIACPDALYVFTVPTALWMMVGVFGQLCKKAANLGSRLRKMAVWATRKGASGIGPEDNAAPSPRGLWSRFLAGHGAYPGFLSACRAFRIGSWRRLFDKNEFTVLRERPLLFYGSSACPVFPSSQALATYGLPASYVFVLRDRGSSSRAQ